MQFLLRADEDKIFKYLGETFEQNYFQQLQTSNLNADIIKWSNKYFEFKVPETLISFYQEQFTPIYMNSFRHTINSKNIIHKQQLVRRILYLIIYKKMKPVQICKIRNFSHYLVYKLYKQIQTKDGQSKITNILKNIKYSKITQNHISLVQDYLDLKKNQKIIVKDIQQYIVLQNPNLDKISKTTLQKLLKKNFNYSYKKASFRFLPTLTKDLQQLKFEVCKLLLYLLRINLNIIFLDEYKISNESYYQYNWIMKGKQGVLLQDEKLKSFSIMSAIDKFGLLLLKIDSKPFNSDYFEGFIKDLQEQINSKRNFSQKEYILFFDNAPIHKAKKIIDFANTNKIQIVTNCPYCPELNACELFIRDHKQKLQIYFQKNKLIRPSDIINEASQIKYESFQGYIKCIQEEAKQFLIKYYLEQI